MLLDFGLMSFLLVAAHILRSRLRILQNLFVPSALLAGLCGLLGSQSCLAILPFDKDPKGVETIREYPGILIVIVFATLFLGHREKRVPVWTTVGNVADTFLYNLASELGQYGLALVVGLTLLPFLFPDLNTGFALMLPSGFAGGYGTSTVIGSVLVEEGWTDALSVGYTFATAGLLAGVVGGLILVNIGTRFGWTQLVKTSQELSEGIRTGFLPPDERPSIGHETVSTISLDPLTWHFALVLCACGVAVLASRGIKASFPWAPAIPLFALSMIAGVLLQKILNLLAVGAYVDRRIMVRIGSAASDYLIAFGIASIQPTIVANYFWPLAVMILFGIVYSVGFFWLLSSRLFGSFWFERGIFVYGWNTGVVGTSIALLRIVDPKLQSRTLEDYGAAYVGLAPLEVALVVLLPPLVARGHIHFPALLLLALTALCVLLCWRLVRGGEGHRARELDCTPVEK